MSKDPIEVARYDVSDTSFFSFSGFSCRFRDLVQQLKLPVEVSYTIDYPAATMHKMTELTGINRVFQLLNAFHDSGMKYVSITVNNATTPSYTSSVEFGLLCGYAQLVYGALYKKLL